MKRAWWSVLCLLGVTVLMVAGAIVLLLTGAFAIERPLTHAALAHMTTLLSYRHAWRAGGPCFFTVNLLERQKDRLLTRHIDDLREAVRHEKVFTRTTGQRMIESVCRIILIEDMCPALRHAA